MLCIECKRLEQEWHSATRALDDAVRHELAAKEAFRLAHSKRSKVRSLMGETEEELFVSDEDFEDWHH